MTEPVNKKSGSTYRKVRARRNEEAKAVINKTKKIQTFFECTSSQNEQCHETHADSNNISEETPVSRTSPITISNKILFSALRHIYYEFISVQSAIDESNTASGVERANEVNLDTEASLNYVQDNSQSNGEIEIGIQ